MQPQPLSPKRFARQKNTAVLTWLAVISPFVIFAAILMAEAYGWR
jgi:hypothetical protein